MRKIKSSLAKSKYVGVLPKGCELCIKGLKSVLFVTGICKVNCYYCPLSHLKKNKDIVVINEKNVSCDEDVINEIKLCKSKGAGITGGDPLLRLERTIHYIKLLKEEFGSKFHLHLYTYGELNENVFREQLKRLYEAGLDEIRFHLDMETKANWHLVKIAREYSWDVGVEVPCIPDKEKHLIEMINYLEEINADFINFNEFEASELTVDRIIERGYELNFDEFNTIKGSYELGKKMIRYVASFTQNLNAHFCESYVKEYYQLRNRMKLRAESVKRKYEVITEEGWLLKGVIHGEDLDALMDELSKTLRVKKTLFFKNEEKGVVETSPAVAKRAAKLGYKAELVWELPSDDRFVMQVEPLNEEME